eukprot:TRINITY_DN1809_c0_g2_i10.p1 TRINITY_DN1809_c0_g2~~TRINITY_DN1809_c0_g2_i10.p1  ORF type:complete len:403 (+),score=152.95 TRINITY_DN1809_c0_g2_i10:220-1428(+)
MVVIRSGSGGTGGGSGGGMAFEDDVRAPIAQKQDILASQGALNANYGAQRGGIAYETPRAVFQVDPFADFKSGQSTHVVEKKQRLAEMFKPPTDLMESGDFEHAKNVAKTLGRILIVNIQKHDEFDSQRLNRDVWNQPQVREVIREHYVFWQQEESTLAGTQFLSWYPTSSLPCVCFIDPRSGERTYHSEGATTKDAFIAILKIHAGVSEDLETSVSYGDDESGPDMSMMTEDEALKFALAASMGKTMSEMSEDGKDSMEEDRGNGEAETTTTTTTTTTASTGDGMDLESEPQKEQPQQEQEASQKSSREDLGRVAVEEGRELDCSIRVQLPSGDMLDASFNGQDPLLAVHNYVDDQLSDEDYRPFRLMETFPRKTYSVDEMSQTLEDLDLTQAKLRVTFEF